MREWLEQMTPDQRAALYRVAKTRAYAFFRDPRHMKLLREMVDAGKV